MMKSHFRDSEKYRPGVGIMLVNQYNQVFVGQRHDSKTEAWQMPQGGIDAGETPIQAMYRELMEEVGTNQIQVIAETKKWKYYDIPLDLAKSLWQGRYIGQRQKWFLTRLRENAAESINIYTSEPEFKDWKWADINDLPNLIVPFKHQLYTEVIEEFNQLLK